jgi:hypothetical protein
MSPFALLPFAPFALCNIQWIDDPNFDPKDLCGSLEEALKAHDAARTGPKPAHAAAG